MNQLIKQTTKSWWAAIWIGLLQEQHLQKMKSSIWLFLYLVLHANRRTGKVMQRRYQTIVKDMGVPLGTIRRWLSTLRKHNYVTVERSGQSLVIYIQKWKPTSAYRYLPKNE